MIDDPLPEDWRDLQVGVKRIFRNIGMSAEVEVNLPTPRGTVNIDVVATDVRSVDKIKYIVECKNWGCSIPQSVVHSFTTVMHETGANIGFIISKYGLQHGARQYTKNTNITGFTYLEFQQRYFDAWWKRYFCPRIGDAADIVLDYVEPFNTHRDREYEKLSPVKQAEFDRLRSMHGNSIMVFSMFNTHVVAPFLGVKGVMGVPEDLEKFKREVLTLITPYVDWHCGTFRGLLETIIRFLKDIEADFNAVFGGCIFETRPSISSVTVDGPPLE